MKIKMSALRRMIVEEMKSLGMLAQLQESDKSSLKSTEDVEAKEIEPGDENQLEKPADMVKLLKIKEAKLIKSIKEVRSSLARLESK